MMLRFQSRHKPYKADEIRQKIKDVQEMSFRHGFMHFRRGLRGGRFFWKPLLYYIRHKPRTIAGFMPFYYLRLRFTEEVIAQAT